MATWVAHFRLAENLLRDGFEFDIAPFLVGNIGPDCGVPNADWSSFDPPKEITHWHDENRQIRPDWFFEKYLAERRTQDSARQAFYVGYYLHLVTDVEWTKVYRQKKRTHPAYRDTLAQNPDFIWEIKKDWYGLDFVFLAEHPHSVFFTTFQYVCDFPDYLDYFPPKATDLQVKYITNFYLNEKPDLDRPFEYLSKEEMDSFIAQTTEVLARSLQDKHHLL